MIWKESAKRNGLRFVSLYSTTLLDVRGEDSVLFNKGVSCSESGLVFCLFSYLVLLVISISHSVILALMFPSYVFVDLDLHNPQSLVCTFRLFPGLHGFQLDLTSLLVCYLPASLSFA